MLKELQVTNFKAWRELQIHFGKVTGLFGENSSGKSSILQLLLLLKQTKNATDRGIVIDFGGPNELVNLGSYRDLVYKKNLKADIGWMLDWELLEKLPLEIPGGSPRSKEKSYEVNRLRLSTRIGVTDARRKNPELMTHCLKYDFSEAAFEIAPKTTGSNEFDLIAHGKHKSRLVRTQGRGRPLPGPIKTHLFPDQARTYFQNTGFLSHFEYQYEDLMDRIFYLGPLREYPQRQYHWSGTSPEGVGQRGERTVDAILAATEAEKRPPANHIKGPILLAIEPRV